MSDSWIKTTSHGSQVVVAPSGEIAYQQANEFRGAIRKAFEQKPTKLVIDLSAVDYMNTPGVATLVEALQVANRSKVALVLCGLNDKVRAIIELARLHSLFKIVPNVSAALA